MWSATTEQLNPGGMNAHQGTGASHLRVWGTMAHGEVPGDLTLRFYRQDAQMGDPHVYMAESKDVAVDGAKWSLSVEADFSGVEPGIYIPVIVSAERLLADPIPLSTEYFAVD